MIFFSVSIYIFVRHGIDYLYPIILVYVCALFNLCGSKLITPKLARFEAVIAQLT